jgi:ABC-2 type transport system permease protein
MTAMTTATATSSPARLAAPPLPRPAGRLAVTAEFVRRSLLHSLRSPDGLIMTIVLPTMLMLLFVFVFGDAIEKDGRYVDYVVPGLIVLCAGYGAATTAVDVASDMTGGIVERFRTLPIRASSVITGHVVSSLLRNLVATGVVIGVALLIGYRPHGSALAWLGTLALVAAWILAITYLFAALGLLASSPDTANGYGFALMFLPYLSSAFVPLGTMPDVLQAVAQWNPITPIVTTTRALLSGGTPGWDALWAVLWCAGVLAVAVTWTAFLFARKAGRR